MALHRKDSIKTIHVQSQGAALKYMQEMDAISTPGSVKSTEATHASTSKKKKKKVKK